MRIRHSCIVYQGSAIKCNTCFAEATTDHQEGAEAGQHSRDGDDDDVEVDFGNLVVNVNNRERLKQKSGMKSSKNNDVFLRLSISAIDNYSNAR